jgi:predicted 2-oxoglutarate/Fe(II)-dependent dioxygenase YbiX
MAEFQTLPGPRLVQKVRLYLRPGFLNAATCHRIRAAMDGGSIDTAEVLDEAVEVRPDARRASSVDVSQATITLVEALFDDERNAIARFFDAELGGREGAGFLRYTEGDFYRPHRDCAELPSWPDAARRHIALVAFLNGGNDFEGGILRLFGGERTVDVRPAGGLLVAFPADVLHEVTMVRRGTRDVVVDWFYSARQLRRVGPG